MNQKKQKYDIFYLLPKSIDSILLEADGKVGVSLRSMYSMNKTNFSALRWLQMKLVRFLMDSEG